MSLIIGKNKVSRYELLSVHTPPATETHFPVPHILLVELVVAELMRLGYTIVEEEHALARNGQRYFGGFAIVGKDMESKDRRLVVGLRNSCDKSFPAAICIGNQMLVCENLCFSSDVKLARRHTKNVLEDLPGVIASAIARLIAHWNDMEDRIAKYKERIISQMEAANLLVELCDVQSLTPRDIYNVIKLWRNPGLAAAGMVKEADFTTWEVIDGAQVERNDVEGYKAALAAKEAELVEAFGGGTLWGLYNGITEVLKDSDLSKLPFRTLRCQATFDQFIGRESFAAQHIGDTPEMLEDGSNELVDDSEPEGAQE